MAGGFLANFAERNTSFFSFCGLRKAQPQVKSSMSNKRILQSWSSVRPAFELSYSSKRCNGCLRWPSDCLYGSLAARHYAGSLGTLSKDGDDGSENVGKKMKLRSFKVNHVFWPVQYVKKMRATFLLKLNSWGFHSGSKRGRKIRRRMSTSSIKRQIRKFHVVVVQLTSKKCTKKRDAREELLFWSLNVLFFEVVVVVVVVVA